MPSKIPIALWISCGVIFLASFAPWISINLNDLSRQMDRGMSEALGRNPDMKRTFGEAFARMPGMNRDMVFKANAWKSNIRLLGIQLPNWLLVLAVIGIVVCDWLNSTGQYNIDRRVLIGIAAYGTAHTAFFCVIAMRRSMTGFGAVATLLAFIVILVVLIRSRQDEEREAYDYTPPDVAEE